MEGSREWAPGWDFSSSGASAPYELFQVRSVGAGCLALESLPLYDRRYIDKAFQESGGMQVFIKNL